MWRNAHSFRFDPEDSLFVNGVIFLNRREQREIEIRVIFPVIRDSKRSRIDFLNIRIGSLIRILPYEQGSELECVFRRDKHFGQVAFRRKDWSRLLELPV